MNEQLQQLASTFAWLSLLQFGGASAIVPGMHRQAVDVFGWMSSGTFANLFALAKLAPGPNVIVVSLVGWQVAGLAGLVVATVAVTVPPCLLAFATSRLMRRAGRSPWLGIVKDGLLPLAIGMILASGWIMAKAANPDTLGIAITVAATAFVVFTEWNLLWALSAAIALGLAAQQFG